MTSRGRQYFVKSIRTVTTQDQSQKAKRDDCWQRASDNALSQQGHYCLSKRQQNVKYVFTVSTVSIERSHQNNKSNQSECTVLWLIESSLSSHLTQLQQTMFPLVYCIRDLLCFITQGNQKRRGVFLGGVGGTCSNCIHGHRMGMYIQRCSSPRHLCSNAPVADLLAVSMNAEFCHHR